MPSAGGESIYGTKGFLPYINAGSVDIVMPDVKYCGGLLELKKIASLAEAAGLKVSPHGPAGPVGNVAAAHVCAGMPNFLILEFSYGEIPWRAELIDPPERIDKGFLWLRVRERYRFGRGDSIIAECTAARSAYPSRSQDKKHQRRKRPYRIAPCL